MMTAADLTIREMEVLRGALHVNIKDLEGYARWVNDRPQLPAIAVALGNIEADVREMYQLIAKLYEAERHARQA